MVSHPVGAGSIPSGLVIRTRPLNDLLEDQMFPWNEAKYTKR